MKKLFMLLVIATWAINGAFAEKGDWALSGSLTFDYSGPDIIDGSKNGESILDFRVAPSLLYAFSNRFYFGGELSANMLYLKDYEADEMVWDGYRNMFGIAPIARYYLYQRRRIAFFGDAKAGIYFGQDKAKTNYMTIAASVTPGIEVFINSRFSVSASLNDVIRFSYDHVTPDGGTSTDRTDFSFLFNRMELNYAPLTFSFTYHFPQRKREATEFIEIDEFRIVR